jgi:hypothetical protein
VPGPTHWKKIGCGVGSVRKEEMRFYSESNSRSHINTRINASGIKCNKQIFIKPKLI